MNLIKTLPDIIKEASRSELGILALLIVSVGLLAYVFFRAATEKIRVAVFVLIFAGAAAYGIAVVKAVRPSGSVTGENPAKQQRDTLVIAGTVVDAADGHGLGQAEVTAVGAKAGTVTDGNGNFRFLVPTQPGSVRLVVSRRGYRATDRLIAPPVESLILQLEPQ
jgi:hypothetical protein